MCEALEPSRNYEYAASGIPVILVGFTGKHGDEITVANINVLHKVIAEAVALKPSQLTGAEIRFLRTELRLTRTALGRTLEKTSARKMRAYEEAEDRLDSRLERVLRQMVLDKFKRPYVVPWEYVERAPQPNYQYRISAGDTENYYRLQ
ncbi:MAG: Transcriptional regulator [Parcubacteria group bacterium]|nr:Transcriptional regulator [Parcubacteria group bacterium]